MSYCRFSGDSDVYLFWSIADDTNPSHVRCCGCRILGGAKSEVLLTFSAALDHVARHRALGHAVPDFVDEELREDRLRYSDDPTAEMVDDVL